MDTPTDERVEAPGAGAPWPWWLRGLVLATVLAAFSQVTLRHWALWLTGVRTGEVAAVTAPAEGEAGAVLHDPFAVYEPDALAGQSLTLGGETFAILGNTPTTLRLDAETAALQALAPAGEDKGYVIGGDGLGGLALRVPGIGFTLADVLLGLTTLALLGWLLSKRRRPLWCLPPWPIWIFLGVGLLSLFGFMHLFAPSGSSPRKGAGLRELVQFVEVLLVGYLVLREALREPRLRRQMSVVLAIGAGLLVVGALWEYNRILGGHTLRGLADMGELDSVLGFRYNPGRSGAAGSESSKNMLSAYLVVLVPLLLALAGGFRRRWARVALIVLAALGFVCILHPLLLLCALAGCLAVAVSWQRRWGIGAVLAGALAVQGIAGLVTPHHGKILMDSVALSRYSDTYGLLPMPKKGKNADTAASWMHDQQKYVELQAALNAVSMSPIFGHGLGNYQEVIGQHYGKSRMISLVVSKEPSNFMEQDAHGLYTVLAVETGLAGLLAMLGLLTAFLARARSTEALSLRDRQLLIGIVGSLIAILLAGCFVSWLVRGLQIIVVLLLATIAGIRHSWAEPEAPEASS